MQHTPDVTALMTTYNCENLVAATIDSVLSQTYRNFELLILDDGSSDHTVEVIRRFTDPRIKLIVCPDNRGVGVRLRQALELVQTEFIVKVDADDISFPHRFEQLRCYLHSHPDIGIVKSYFEYFTDDPEVADSERFRQFRRSKETQHNEVNTPQRIAQELRRWNCVLHASYMGRTSVVRSVGYPEDRVGEDYSLMYRAVLAGHQIDCVKQVLLKFRLSQTSLTTRPDSARHFAQALVRLKWAAIQSIYARHGKLWILGTGGLASAVAAVLSELDLVPSGFIERNTESLASLCGLALPVRILDENVPGGILIAAQPVRAEMVDLLSSMGMQEWQDFMVIG